MDHISLSSWYEYEILFILVEYFSANSESKKRKNYFNYLFRCMPLTSDLPPVGTFTHKVCVNRKFLTNCFLSETSLRISGQRTEQMKVEHSSFP